MRKYRVIITMMWAVLFLFALSNGIVAECRLLMMTARNDNEKIFACEEYWEAFELLSVQAEQSYMADGWGITYYEKGDTTTGEGKIWIDPEDAENYYWCNRYASPVRVWQDGNNYNEVISRLGVEIDTKIILAHVRQATFGQGDVPNPHPFVFEFNGHSYTFAHNGSVPGVDYVMAMRDVVQDFIDAGEWEYDNWSSLLESDVDSAVYFAYVLAHIKDHGWDILRGLRAALQTNLLIHPGWTGRNFIFSDGFDVYAYRSVGWEGMAPSYRLEYKTVNEGTDYEAIIIMSVLPEGDNATALEPDELLYIPQYGSPVRFRHFNREVIYWRKEVRPPAPDIAPFWTWSSFPVLDTGLDNEEAGSIDTITQNYEPNGSGEGLESAIYVENIDGASIFREDMFSDWEYGEPALDVLKQTEGYKIQYQSYTEESRAYIAGDIVPAERTITLRPNTDNWVGYWLLNSQTVGQALGETWKNIKSVSSVNWSYHTLKSSSCPDYTMEFGQMYKIRLHDQTFGPIRFSWNNSRTPGRGRRIRGARFFRYEQQAEYNVIDITGIEDDEGIIEIGVFAGNRCIGAARSGSYPVQILTYPQGYEGLELEFRFYYGNNRVLRTNLIPLLYDEKSGEYIRETLVAGKYEYKSVRLAADDNAEMNLPKHNLNVSAAPNPFNPGTTISMELTDESIVNIEIYNILGRKVRSLFSGTQLTGKGYYYWDGTDDNNKKASSGVYIYKIEAGGQRAVGKLLMLK